MTVLSKKTIHSRMRIPANDERSLVITPLLDKASFDEDSIDLRLGTHFLLPQIPPQPYFDQSGSRYAKQTYLQLHAPIGSYFVLAAHQTVLGATLEFIKMPFDLAGEILTKSSVARMFMLIETAPWIHPSYRGCLTLEIANVSNASILLYPGMPIGQLILMETGIDREPTGLSGSYVGPVFPEAPNPSAAREQLRLIGVEAYRRPGHGWVREGQMRKDVQALLEGITPQEKANIQRLIQILTDNGGLPSDSPISEFVK
jgi:dCTP deaminase